MLAALIAIVGAGCSSPPAAEVWVAGEKHTASGQRLAVLWRNGAGTTLPSRSPGDDSFATAIAVDGSDVYAGGVSSETVGAAPVEHPGYWRNGAWVGLPTLGGTRATVNALVAQGGVLRVGGAVEDPATGFLLPGTWINGPPGISALGPVLPTASSVPVGFAPLPLPADARGGELLSVRLVGGALLATGSFWRAPAPGVDPERVPVLWQDGIRRELPLASGAVGALAFDVCVDRGTTFVVGHQFLGGPLTAPGYWRDGTWVELPRAAANLPGLTSRCLVVAGELVVAGGRVATVGPVWVGTGGYWRNGAWTTFSDPTHLDITMAQDLAVDGGDLLVAGAKVPGDVLTHSVGGYWRGAAWVPLAIGPDEWGSVANALVVRPP